MRVRESSFWLPVVLVAWVALAALRTEPSAVAPWLALATMPALTGWAFRRTGARVGDSDDRAWLRGATRALGVGAPLFVAGSSGAAGHPGLEAAAQVGAATASVAALVAVARIEGMGGLARPAQAARRLDGAGLVALVWTISIALHVLRAVAPERMALLHPDAPELAASASGLGASVVLLATASRAHVLRRLELGVGDRTAAALSLAAAAIVTPLPAVGFGLADAHVALPASALAGALAVSAACVADDAAALAFAQRTVLGVTLVLAPLTLLGAWVAREAPARAPAAVVVLAAVGVSVGLLARLLARALGRGRSTWLAAIERATDAALEPEPERALARALGALARLVPHPHEPARIWRLDPPGSVHVDLAGYLHEERAPVPSELLALAAGEPLGTLRADVLASVEVRMPELRPRLAWMRTHGAFAVTAISDDDGPAAMLVVPAGTRRATLSIEEARALRRLGDRLGAVASVASALARSRARELETEARLEAIAHEADRLRHLVAASGGRHRAFASRLAASVRRSAYSPAARFAVDEIERVGSLGIPVTLLAPPGVDPAPWAAIAHVASVRRDGPFVVVDAADGALHEPSAWTIGDGSPLALADGGTLVVVGAAALPLATQEAIATLLAERRSPAGHAAALELGLVLTLPATVDALAAADRIAPAFADRVGDRAVALPALVDRGEDLRALALDRLARLGLRLRGEPLGLDARALAALVEHELPGNDAELDALLTKAAARAAHGVVRLEDLERAGLGAAPRSERPSSPRRRRDAS